MNHTRWGFTPPQQRDTLSSFLSAVNVCCGCCYAPLEAALGNRGNPRCSDRFVDAGEVPRNRYVSSHNSGEIDPKILA